MKINIPDIRQLTKDLLVRWLDNKEYLDDNAKRILYTIGCENQSNMSKLYDINRALISKQLIENETYRLMLAEDEDTCELTFRDEAVRIDRNCFKKTIAGMIDILEEILPMGSVVDLKKEYLGEKFKTEEIGNIRIVITQRFTYIKGDTAYFPYVGVVYPVGMVSDARTVQFTSSLINNVVFKGFSDIMEEAYVYAIKEELILRKGMHSRGFLLKDTDISYNEVNMSK